MRRGTLGGGRSRMRLDSIQTSGLGVADGGFFDDDLVLTPPPYRPDGPVEDEALRLATPAPETPPRPPRRKGLSLPVVMAGWAAVLGLALGAAAYVAQPSAPPDPADQPPIPQPTAGAELGTPLTAAPIASRPDQFAPAPAPDTAGQAAQLTLAEASPPDPPPLEVKPAPPDPPEPPPLQTPAAAPKPAPATVQKATEQAPPAKADKAVQPVKSKVVPVKAAKAIAKPSRSEKAVAGPKDLPKLKAQLNRAYAEAVKAGTPKSVLKARQAEWITLRAKAEKKGPAAVSALYRTRAAQLEALAKKKAARARNKA